MKSALRFTALLMLACTLSWLGGPARADTVDLSSPLEIVTDEETLATWGIGLMVALAIAGAVVLGAVWLAIGLLASMMTVVMTLVMALVAGVMALFGIGLPVMLLAAAFLVVSVCLLGSSALLLWPLWLLAAGLVWLWKSSASPRKPRQAARAVVEPSHDEFVHRS